MDRRTATILLLSLVLITVTEGLALPTTFSFHIENDGLAGPGDRYYTSGLLLSGSRPGAPGWLPDFGVPEGDKSWAWEVGQVISTPLDVSRGKPHPGDRPYAGILFLAGSLQVRRERGMDQLKVTTGILGPAAGGREVQGLVHRALGTSDPSGWNHQLGQEVLLNLAYEHRHRVRLAPRREAWGAELIALGGAMVGNMLTRARAGLRLRWGYRLPDDFGQTLIRGAGQFPSPGRSGFGFRIMTGITGTFSVRDITIDGNTFRDSFSADRRPFFASYELGAAVAFRHVELAYAIVFTGREFDGQRGNDYFGAFSVTTGF